MATNPRPLSVDAAIKLLTSTMRDSMTTTICSKRMSLAADRIDQALEACDSVSAKTKLAKSYPEFLRAGIKFLTFNQSPQDFMKMVDRLNTCHCDFRHPEVKRLHTPTRRRADGRRVVRSYALLFDAVATVTNCIILALSELTQHRFRTGNASNGEQRWPQGPKDLLPFGPKDSVAGLEHWVARPPEGYIVFKLAGCLASSHGPFAREVFQSPNFSFAMGRTCQHLEVSIKFYHEGDSSPLARMHFFDHPVMTIFQFFNVLSVIDAQQYNLMSVACGDWLKPILPPLTTILSTLSPEWTKIRLLVNYLSSYANADFDRKTGVALIKFERSQFDEAIQQRAPLEDAFTAMVVARKMGCWNIECPSVSEVLHSRLCMPKDAWKSPPLPHKAVYAKIYSLKESLGSANWTLLWTPDFTKTQFQAMCTMKNIDIKTVTVVTSTISALRHRRGAFLDDAKKAGALQKDRLIRAEQEILSLEKLKNAVDDFGDPNQVTLIDNREKSFWRVNPDAYKLGRTIKPETTLARIDDVD